MASGILQEIVEKRRQRIGAEGHCLGSPVPPVRRAPLVRFGRPPFLACEIKRRSPSRGWIARDLDARAQARSYAADGVRNISVLTEEDHFAGSLADLMAVKEAAPGAAVLRKDFLLDEEDVEVSYRAGADAVLLIASVLSGRELGALHGRAEALGMEALVEVHDEADIEKAASVSPSLVGINSRNLALFTTDLLHPIRMRGRVAWPARAVFESGIRDAEDARLALSSGFDGVLAGESVVRDGAKVRALLGAFRDAEGGLRAGFWRKLCSRMSAGRPLVKICGITREEDARIAADLGADLLGFVFAPSPRRADPEVVKEIHGLDVVKVAVVVDEEGRALAARLYEEGLIEAVQLHGDETPEQCSRAALPYYKAVRIGSMEDVPRIAGYRCPRVLVDAFGPSARGGTGMRIPPEIVAEVKKRHALWLAGGVGPGNVRGIIGAFSPELIDASSGLESAPGVKDRDKLEKYFEEMHRGKES